MTIESWNGAESHRRCRRRRMRRIHGQTDDALQRIRRRRSSGGSDAGKIWMTAPRRHERRLSLRLRNRRCRDGHRRRWSGGGRRQLRGSRGRRLLLLLLLLCGGRNGEAGESVGRGGG